MTLKSAETNNQEILDWFSDHNLPAKNTKVYLSSKPIPSKNAQIDPSGVFYPKSLEGYIWLSDIYESYFTILNHRYAHELSHGVCCENFEFGKKLVSLDKTVDEKEVKLFSNTAPPFYVITDLLQTQKFDEDIPKITVDKQNFQEYLTARENLDLLYKKSWSYIEGFALLIHEKIFGHPDSAQPKHYQQAFLFIKQLEAEIGGFKELTNYFKNLDL